MAQIKQAESAAPSMDVTNLVAETASPDGPLATPEEIVAEAIMRQTDAPTQMPPSEAAMAAEVEGVAAWHNGKKVLALWCDASARNATMSIDGLGWRRVANTNDSAFLNMTMMASHAEQTNANVNVEIGADGMVHTLYVW